MKEKDANLLTFGIFNAISVIPVLCLDVLVTFVMYVLMGMKMNIWTDIFLFLIIVLSPISCVIGIVQGIRRRKNSRICAPVCIILSIIGILLFAVVLGFFWWRISIP